MGRVDGFGTWSAFGVSCVCSWLAGLGTGKKQKNDEDEMANGL